MLHDYFRKTNDQLLKNYRALYGKKKTEKEENETPVEIIEPLVQFFQDHFLAEYQFMSGATALDSFGHKVEDIDILMVYRLHSKVLEMLGKGAAVELIYGAVFVAPRLTAENLNHFLQRVLSFKRLSPRVEADDNAERRKIPATILAYESNLSFHQIKDYIDNFYRTHDILNPYEVDFVATLGHSLIIKDWHNQTKKYKAIETKQDSLMWLYVLMYEYILGDDPSRTGFDYRHYVQDATEYNEY